MNNTIDAIKLSSDLIKIKSVTPKVGKTIDIIKSKLEKLNFKCEKLVFGKGEEKVENLYARLGSKKPNLCFAGHVDVVPAGNIDDWSFEPFSGKVENKMILGRGAVDMKSSIACFISAVSHFLSKQSSFLEKGSLSFLITGDEEGKAINGSKKVVEWLKKNKEEISGCILGEPTNPNNLGEMIKIGRRGSYSGDLVVYGVQGHVGYPHLADNPINKILKMIEPLTKVALDEGTVDFEPSTVMITSIDVGNLSYNVIPSKVSLKFNVRFNNLHSSHSITKMLKKHFNTFQNKFDFTYYCNAEPFLTNPGHLIGSMEKAITQITKLTPQKSTTGGTSDARFIQDICPVIEFGLVGKLMHKVDEKVPVEEVIKLKEIYENFLNIFFEDKKYD